MAAVKVTSLEQVTQMAAVVAIATEQKDEISQSSQVSESSKMAYLSVTVAFFLLMVTEEIDDTFLSVG